MAETWDELWENATIVDTNPDSWLGKIKIEGDKLKEKAILYEASHPLKRRKFFTERHVLIGLQAVREEWKEKAEKWDKAYSGVDDDEMPFTPERISLVMNYVNDHHPDFDTSKEFEDMITEYIKWEGELGEAEEKLEAIKKVYNEMYQDYMGSRTTPLVSNYIPKFKKILEGS